VSFVLEPVNCWKSPRVDAEAQEQGQGRV
jgi:hypothetical protein